MLYYFTQEDVTLALVVQNAAYTAPQPPRYAKWEVLQNHAPAGCTALFLHKPDGPGHFICWRQSPEDGKWYELDSIPYGQRQHRGQVKELTEEDWLNFKGTMSTTVRRDAYTSNTTCMKLKSDRRTDMPETHTMEYVDLQTVTFLSEINTHRPAVGWIREDYPGQSYHLPLGPVAGAASMRPKASSLTAPGACRQGDAKATKAENQTVLGPIGQNTKGQQRPIKRKQEIGHAENGTKGTITNKKPLITTTTGSLTGLSMKGPIQAHASSIPPQAANCKQGQDTGKPGHSTLDPAVPGLRSQKDIRTFFTAAHDKVFPVSQLLTKPCEAPELRQLQKRMRHLTEDELLACKTSVSDELDKALETEEIPKRDQSEAKRMQAENPMNDGGVEPSGAINREQNSARTDAMTNEQRNYEIPTQKFPNVTEAEWQAIQTICGSEQDSKKGGG